MRISLLDEPAFKATLVEPIHPVTDEAPTVDFWAYFDEIPADDFAGHDCSAGDVQYVYRMSDRYEHALVRSTTANVFMAIVLDLTERAVVGHRLLNFNQMYGVDET